MRIQNFRLAWPVIAVELIRINQNQRQYCQVERKRSFRAYCYQCNKGDHLHCKILKGEMAR